GDVIVEANGKPVTDARALRLMVSSMAPGSQVNLRVLHNGGTKTAVLTLGDLSKIEAAAAPKTPPAEQQSARQKPSPSDGPRLGVAIAEMTPQIAQDLKVPESTKGVVIANVEDGSPAAEAGLQMGDIIEQVDRKPIATIGDFRSTVTQHSASTPILFLVN